MYNARKMFTCILFTLLFTIRCQEWPLTMDAPLWGGVDISVNAHAYAYVYLKSRSFFLVILSCMIESTLFKYDSTPHNVIQPVLYYFLCRKLMASLPNIVHSFLNFWNTSTLAKTAVLRLVISLWLSQARLWLTTDHVFMKFLNS